jgi:ubiquinone/menaquinone biosynthesis C-methylase UbiE
MFDIVHIRNALDHTIDPVKSMFEMNKVLKKNGFLIIHGFENEAIFENWQGMHQWNLSLEKNLLLISNIDGFVNDFSMLNSKAVYTKRVSLDNSKNWITIILKKLS